MSTGSQHQQYDVMENDFLYQQQQYQQYLQQQQLQLQQQQHYLQQLSQQHHGEVNATAIQQLEYERIRQVQEQASIQQQRALFHQQMMYYQQEIQQDPSIYQMDMPMYASRTSTSPSTQYQEPITNDKKAQKRAEHNAIERARRECLNTKFQQLAHSLPNLHNDKRPSKGTIIERTLEYVRETVEKEERLQSEIDELRQVNEDLIKKMTSDHFDQLDDEQVDYDEYENTPDCDDNFSSRSSITSNSSHQQQQQLYQINNVLEKNDSSSLFMNRELQFSSQYK